MPSKIEELTITELKSRLLHAAKQSRKLMAPMLYYLRQKIKAQGKAGQGFGQWVEDNLDITRRTADRWANEWAVSQKLRKPSKPKPKAFRQMSKSAQASPDGKVTVPLSFVLPDKEAEEFIAAMQLLGDKATSIIYNAVVVAARTHKKPAQPAATPKQRLTFLNDEEDSAFLASTEAQAQ